MTPRRKLIMRALIEHARRYGEDLGDGRVRVTTALLAPLIHQTPREVAGKLRFLGAKHERRGGRVTWTLRLPVRT